jgi:hypothetical protein
MINECKLTALLRLTVSGTWYCRSAAINSSLNRTLICVSLFFISYPFIIWAIWPNSKPANSIYLPILRDVSITAMPQIHRQLAALAVGRTSYS